MAPGRVSGDAAIPVDEAPVERRVSTIASPGVLEGEDRIVWLHSPQLYRYVRELVAECSYRARPPARSDYTGRLVAYATLRPDFHSVLPGRFLRRLWWVAYHDPYEGGGCPSEGVDPLSIRAGRCSLHPHNPYYVQGAAPAELAKLGGTRFSLNLG